MTRDRYVRKGSGVYFWAESRRYLELAKAWYDQRRSRGDFDSDRDPRGIVLIGVAETTEDGYLDLEDVQVIDAIDEFVEARKIDVSTPRKVSEAIDEFVETTEEETGVPIVLVGVRVTPPDPCPGYCVMLRGHPLCYVVRRPEYLRVADTIEVVDL